MVKLLVLSGSRHSTQAEKLLKDTGVEFERIDVSDSRMLSGVNRDLGINRLPVLIDQQTRYEGIRRIRDYLSDSA